MNIPDDQLPLIIRALEHYADYLKATQRDDRFFREIRRAAPARARREMIRKARNRFI